MDRHFINPNGMYYVAVGAPADYAPEGHTEIFPPSPEHTWKNGEWVLSSQALNQKIITAPKTGFGGPTGKEIFNVHNG